MTTGVSRDVGVIIVAGGSGSRATNASAPAELKQFRWVAGKPMLLHSVQTFMQRDDVCSVVCVLPRDRVGDPPPWLFQCDVDRLMLSIGGRTRTESVYNGLQDLIDEAKIVLVHDAARPFVDLGVIERVVGAVRTGHPAIAAVPAVDTLKLVDAQGAIVDTIDRERVWAAQTPQGFPRDLIVRAYREARATGITASDDAGLCERLGVTIRVVPGSDRNFKITTEADFARAESIASPHP
jgi:2-C-methyl-D-erythritol 4-phosphate cytidylyltransferase